MATIVTRAGKGSALTWTEGDANITNLNNAKIENVVEDLTPQLGGNLDVNGNSIVSTSNANINITPDGTGKVVTTKTLNANILASTQSAGDEGGQFELALAATNTTLSSGVAIDINQNRLRFFETGGTTRGAYIDLTAAATGVGTNLLAPDIVNDTTPQLGGNLDVNGKDIVSVSNGNITITPNGTGQTVIKNIEYNENIFSLGTTSGTIAPNVANGNVQTITLNGNLTLNAFTSPVAGQSLTLIINTNGTGRTLTSTMKFAGGSKTLSTTSTTDIITVFYDGTNYWASLGKDFK